MTTYEEYKERFSGNEGYEDAAREWPLWLAPAMSLLADESPLTDKQRETILRRLVTRLSDDDLLRRVSAADDDAAPADFYGENITETPDTAQTISSFNSFLTGLGGGSPAADDALEELPLEIPIVPAYDYAATLEQTPAPAPRREPAQQSGKLSLSLASVMVKNGNYTKALEILSELNLRNSEKSVYFADQIRFLRKLIINAKNS